MARTRQKMWSAMRVMRRFTMDDVAMAAEASEANTRKYFRGLRMSGHIVETGAVPSKNGYPQRVFRLARDTGPRAPHVRHEPGLITVTDPNTGEVKSKETTSKEVFMKRIRVVEALRSWDEVDEKLREIGRLQIDAEELENEMDEKIKRIKERYVTKVKMLREEAEKLTLSIQAFAQAHREAFGDAKSKAMNYGVLGWRKSTKLVLRRLADTLARLKDAGLDEYIKVKESVDKSKLREAPQEVLDQVGAKLKSEDIFFVEPDREKVKQ